MVLFKKRAIRSSQAVQEKKRMLIIRFSLITSIVAALVAIFSLIAHLPEITITEISVEGVDTLSSEEIRSGGEEYIQGNHWYFFPRANVFLYPRGSIEENILDTYPEVASVRVSRKGFTAMKIVVNERVEKYVWCGGSLPEQETPIQQQCYFLDSTGVIFSQAPRFSGNIFLEIYSTTTNQSVRERALYKKPLGVFAMDTAALDRLIDFSHIFNENGLIVNTLVCQENRDCSFVLESGVEIKFTQDQEFTNVYNKLQTVLKTEQLNQEDIVSPETTLEYVDLRFDKRVFFRFVDETEKEGE